MILTPIQRAMAELKMEDEPRLQISVGLVDNKSGQMVDKKGAKCKQP